MSSKADFNLVVGAEISASYEEMRKDLKVIINTLNKQPYKIKLGLDMASASKDVNKLKTDISELSKSAANIKFSDQISNSLNNITANLKTLTESVAGVSGLKGELLALSEAMRSFQGISINLTSGKNPVQQMSQYGQSARQTISELKAQATELEQFLQKYYNVSDRAAALMKTISGTNALQGKNIFSILGDINNPNLSMTKQMDAWKEYIALMQKGASIKGIDLTPVTSQFNKNADEMVSGTRKILTGEQQVEAGTEKLKSIFGSGVNSEALISKLEEIRLSIERITTSLTELNSKEIKIKVDEASINSIKAEITQLVTQITEAAAKLNVVKTTKKTSSSSTSTSTKSQYQEASKAIKEYYSLLTELSKTETDITKVDGNYVSPSGKWEKLAASLNRVAAAFETLTGAESRNTMTSDEQAKLTQQLAAAEDEYQRKLEASTNKSEEAAARKEREAAAAEEAARAKREEAEAERAEKAAQEDAARAAREAEAAKKAAESTTRNYNNAVAQGESALKRWSAAAHSGNESSRQAYQALVNSFNELKRAQELYGTGSKEVNEATKNFRNTLKSTQATLTANGDATQSLTDKVGGLAKKFGSWLTVSQVIMYAYRTVKKMISVSIELDSAMTQMQIVTKAASDEMKNFGNEAAKSAQKTASSITDIVDSATTFARLGYDMQDSTKLAEYTAMLKNVGDIDVSDAQDAITSIIKAYDKDASEIESIMDKLVETGNNFPISVSQIAEGMNNASSTLAASGNTFEQSVALLTAANTTIQDASKSSTGLRTIAARIRNTKTELDDLGEVMTKANYEELVSNLTDAGVRLTDINGEYRSTYDIMSDIAAKWDEMSNTEQAAMATALSGTRQQAVFYSIIEQFKEASGAMDAMTGSAGALDRAYSTYLDSTQAHINQLKAKFEELSTSVMDSNSTKAFIDALGTILDRLNDIVNVTGAIPPLLATISGYLSFKKNFGRTNMFVLDVNMPKAIIVPLGYERFRYCGCCDTAA